MDMGNERSSFEVKTFQSLFGKHRVVDGTGFQYARLCRKVAGKVPGQRSMSKKGSGNRKIFRFLTAGIHFFCGICLALSVIAPGLSFSTLLMPLGLYQPFVDGIGEFDFSVLIPAGIGALLTVILFAKAVEVLFRKFYSVSFHAIVGIVIAATVMILPLSGFTTLSSALICVACLVVGIALALLLDRFNRRFESKM
jgi:uncharacterized membrane protein